MPEVQLQTYQVQDHSEEQDRFYQHLLTSSIDWATKHGKDPDPFQDPELSDIITTSYLVTPFGPWCDKFNRAHKAAALIDQHGERYARTIQHALSTPEVKSACLVQHPDLDWRKYFPQPNAPQPSRQIQPEATPHTKPHRHKPRNQTISEFVINEAPSLNYRRVWLFILNHTRNRLSSRGRYIYPYGHEYAANQLKISLATVERIFSWLKSRHLIFKRTNENFEDHKCSTWFICISFKQSAFHFDPNNRRRKKGSKQPRKTARK